MQTDQNHRFESLKTILKWEGRLNNSRIRELFELSATRASEWIRDFRDMHPSWLAWDTISRSYLATADLYDHRPGTGAMEQEATSLARYLTLAGIAHTAGPLPGTPSLWNAYPLKKHLIAD